MARNVVRRHRLAESLFANILDLDAEKREEIACEVEHTLLPEVEEAICTLLGHPAICPDGKPIPLGGSLGRKEATGRGVAITTHELLKQTGRELAGTTVAVQGYGNVGSFAATILDEMGCTIMAVSDVTGGIYHPKGLDIGQINRYLADNPGCLLDSYDAPGLERISNEKLLTSEVVAERPGAVGQGGAAAVFAQHEVGFGEPDVFGPHDLVRGSFFEHPVLVNPRLVGEGVAAHNGLVSLYAHPGDR